jgi:hypothetical protein
LHQVSWLSFSNFLFFRKKYGKERQSVLYLSREFDILGDILLAFRLFTKGYIFFLFVNLFWAFVLVFPPFYIESLAAARAKAGAEYKLNTTEVTAIRQLIASYRESAAFLYRSADELEALLPASMLPPQKAVR